jgi:hypothetical protein
MFHAFNELLVFITTSAVLTAGINEAHFEGVYADIHETSKIVHQLTFGFGGDLTMIEGVANERAPSAIYN